MITITDLPVELILIILEKKQITTKDVECFSDTCTKFQRIIINNKLIEKKKDMDRRREIQMFLSFLSINFFVYFTWLIHCTKRNFVKTWPKIYLNNFMQKISCENDRLNLACSASLILCVIEKNYSYKTMRW